MKLKTYLIASATLFAGSSAFASDLPVVAEPIEYVSVCDAYGAGYFQLPGKDTCIRVSGGVRTWYTSHNLFENSGVTREAVAAIWTTDGTDEVSEEEAKAKIDELQTDFVKHRDAEITEYLKENEFKEGSADIPAGTPSEQIISEADLEARQAEAKADAQDALSITQDLTKEVTKAVEEKRNDYSLKTRGYLTLQSMTQTELMSVKTYTSIWTNWDDSANDSLTVFDAYAQFGFDGVDVLVGRTLSLFLPFSGYTLNYAGIPVGGHRALQAQTSFELVDNFTASFGVETSSYTGGPEGGLDFTGAIKYSGGMFNLGLMGAAHRVNDNDYGYGLSGYIELTSFEKLTVGLGATYAQDVHNYLGLDGDTTGFSDGDGFHGYNIYAGLSYDLTEKVNFALDGMYATLNNDSAEYSVNGVNATLTFKPVSGLSLSVDGGMFTDSNDNETAKVTGRVQYTF